MDLEALTSGDTISVTVNVTGTPAPPLRGEITKIEGEVDEVYERLNETGERTFHYRESHHGFEDYEFRTEGCRSTTTDDE